MSGCFTTEIATRMSRQLSEFVSRYIDRLDIGWPRLPSMAAPKATEGHCELGLAVLVIGELVIELPISVEGTKRQLLASFQEKRCNTGLRWAFLEPRVGGFAARAARVADALGAAVSVCTVVPVPMPARIDTFLEAHNVDRRYITGLPSPCPITILLMCTDGVVAVRRRSVVSAAGVNPPPPTEMGHDVILADPSLLSGRGAIIRNLSRYLDGSTKGPVIGLRLDHHWHHSDYSLMRDDRVWSFIRLRDARKLLDRIAPTESADENTLLRRLHDRCGVAKLVMQLGARGAVLMNGIPCPYRVHTCPLDSRDGAGSGDTLLTVTTLSSASGADDKTSLRRGVAAATGYAAGLELPTNLEELDPV